MGFDRISYNQDFIAGLGKNHNFFWWFLFAGVGNDLWLGKWVVVVHPNCEILKSLQSCHFFRDSKKDFFKKSEKNDKKTEILRKRKIIRKMKNSGKKLILKLMKKGNNEIEDVIWFFFFKFKNFGK